VSAPAPRRIKLVLLIATLEQSGAEKQLVLLARGLPRAAFDVDVVALTRGGFYAQVLRDAGVRVHVVGKRRKLDLQALRRLRALVRRLDPDVIHAWMFTANAYARLLFSGRRRPAVIASERGSDGWKHGWQHVVDRLLVGRASRMVANAPEVAREAAERGFPPARIVVVRNGVSLPDGPRPPAPLDPRIRPGARVVGSVGRLADGKRIEDLIDAAALLRAHAPDATLLLIGDGPLRAALERRAATLGLGDAVLFTGHRSDAADLVRGFDAFWLASASEGMSNGLLEAMAAGTPVVASDIPTNRELIVDGVTGHLVPLGSPRDLADATVRLWRDPARRGALTAAALAHVRRELGVDVMVDAYARLYREVAHEVGVPAAAADRARAGREG
jgi:glycosyltransferase involved in cell wall biosynthesis